MVSGYDKDPQIRRDRAGVPDTKPGEAVSDQGEYLARRAEDAATSRPPDQLFRSVMRMPANASLPIETVTRMTAP
jgi:hypothetical protein